MKNLRNKKKFNAPELEERKIEENVNEELSIEIQDDILGMIDTAMIEAKKKYPGYEKAIDTFLSTIGTAAASIRNTETVEEKSKPVEEKKTKEKKEMKEKKDKDFIDEYKEKKKVIIIESEDDYNFGNDEETDETESYFDDDIFDFGDDEED